MYKTYKIIGNKATEMPWKESVVFKHVAQMDVLRPRVIYADVLSLEGLVTQIIAFMEDKTVCYFVTVVQHDDTKEEKDVMLEFNEAMRTAKTY